MYHNTLSQLISLNMEAPKEMSTNNTKLNGVPLEIKAFGMLYTHLGGHCHVYVLCVYVCFDEPHHPWLRYL